MEVFKEYVESYQPIPARDWQRVAACFRKRLVKRNEFVLREGKICRHLYFLEEGLLRYFITKDGVETTKFFTVAPYCFTSQTSFNNRIPAKESIQAIEDSVIWETAFEENQQLLEMKAWNLFARKVTQEVQYFTEEILEALQTETAERRYAKMLETQSELLRRVPLKHLASYLGIAPQSLSRIRKKLT